MQPRLRRYAAFLLTVFTVGALALPFAHEFTHVHTLEHRHGQPAADLSKIATGPGGLEAVDFLVEERTEPHNPDCDLCARLTLDAPRLTDAAVPFLHVDDRHCRDDQGRASAAPFSYQIRAPPVVS